MTATTTVTPTAAHTTATCLSNNALQDAPTVAVII